MNLSAGAGSQLDSLSAPGRIVLDVKVHRAVGVGT